MRRTDNGEVSIKQLRGLLYDPKRKLLSIIEEMREGMMRAVAKANVPARTKTTKR
jgi:hypothetical protein